MVRCHLRGTAGAGRETCFVRENGKLLARVHENRGNILVYARVRPPTSEELVAPDALEVVQILSETELAFYDDGKRYVPCAAGPSLGL